MKCARCHRRIKGAFTHLLGLPVGPVCAKKMDLPADKKDHTAKVVRDDKTKDLFESEAWTE
jgi:hypothetical protein